MKHRFIARSVRIGLILLAVSVPLALKVSAALADATGGQEEKVQFTGKEHTDILFAKVFAAGGTMALSVLAAGYAVGRVGAAAMGAASEKPEVLNRAVVLVALGEGLAIMGLVVAIMLLGAGPKLS